MRKTISQREARGLRKRVQHLESVLYKQRSTWSQQWFGGTRISYVKWDKSDALPVAIRTARALNHAVAITTDDEGGVYFWALPHPSEDV